mgnify:CR=1 FL=1
MANNLILSFRAVAPVFLLILLGMAFKRTKFLPENFYPSVDKLVFKVTLPILIFLNVAGARLSDDGSYLKIIAYIIPAIIILSVLNALAWWLLLRDRAKCGAMVQGVMHSNLAILGLALLGNVFPDASTSAAAVSLFSVVMPFHIIVQNTVVVVWLSVFSPKQESAKKGGSVFIRVMKDIAKNPLIVAALAGLPFMIFEVSFPPVIDKTLNYLAGLTTPLALISLGAGFSFASLKGKLGCALSGALLKTAIQPAAMIFIGYLLGFRGMELLVIFFLFGTPTAVASYVIAKNMKSDYELAGQIVMLSTLFCIVTVFVALYLMRTVGWIV